MAIFCFFAVFSIQTSVFAQQQISTVANVLTRDNTAQAALQGNITYALGNDRYLFRDHSGEIIIEITQDRWQGMFVSPADSIEISGGLNRTGNNLQAVYMEVERITKISEQQISHTAGNIFTWPVNGRLTSAFGWRRSPVTGRQNFHNGIDIAAPAGTPVRAAQSGQVTSAGYNNVYGNYIIITHRGGYSTLYGHLSTTLTRTGAAVETGEHIGAVGSTGTSTGPHLHFTIYRSGTAVNPINLLTR